jgi:hypothetical protein
MSENQNKQIVEREIREAELQMTGHPPASPTGFIGFVPAAPSNGSVPSQGIPATTGDAAESSGQQS